MQLPVTFSIQPRLFALLTLGFVLATIIGTVTHEMGHYVMMKRYGFNPTIHYASASYGYNPEYEKFSGFYEAHKEKIQSAEGSPEKEYFYNRLQKQKRELFLITLGGPVQTMLTGTMGLLLLWFYRKRLYINNKLKPIAWIAVFLAFFWSRQVLNFLMSVPDIFKERRYYRSDEPRISLYLNLPHWSFGMATAIIGAVLLIWVVFYVIPKQQRLSFLCAGLVSSALGWFLWMDVVGPVVLP